MPGRRPRQPLPLTRIVKIAQARPSLLLALQLPCFGQQLADAHGHQAVPGTVAIARSDEVNIVGIDRPGLVLQQIAEVEDGQSALAQAQESPDHASIDIAIGEIAGVLLLFRRESLAPGGYRLNEVGTV